MISKSQELKKLKQIKIPYKIKTSLILFIIIAFNAALFAWSLKVQKLINKYEHNPTPSQPINNCNKFVDVTKMNIKSVNKVKNDKNLAKKGSFCI